MRAPMFLLLWLAMATMAVAVAEPSLAVHAGYSFDQYLKDFDKTYADAIEYAERERIFAQRLRDVVAHNAEPRHSWKKGINHLSDWTDAELEAIVQHPTPPRMESLIAKPHVRPHTAAATTAPLPSVVDYRRNFPPVLTGIKDQGRCGSCYATTATALAETAWAMKTGQLFVLSLQQLTSCPPNVRQCGGKGGCKGNIVTQVFDWVVENGGRFSQEWGYPYTSYWGVVPPCNDTARRSIAAITGYTLVEPNNDAAMMEALAHAGPLSVTFAVEKPFFTYSSGVYPACNYSNNITMNHGVQLVGYGYDSEANMDYWLMRNSWSASWGEGGYVRLQRPTTMQCGWNSPAQSGEACADEPTVQRVCGSCGIALAPVYPNV